MAGAIYSVGDLHGRLDQLDRVLELIEADGGGAERCVFLGDFCDRGPDTRGVIEALVQGRAEGRRWECLKGNHDRMFEWFLESPPRHDPHLIVGYHWLNEALGGRETLASYGVEYADRTRLKDVHAQFVEAVPDAHKAFLADLSLFGETDELFFAHAGIRPGVPLPEQAEEDLLWIRREFHDAPGPFPKLIVHGHTPVSEATHYGVRVNLDTGAGFGRPASAVVFEGGASWLLTDAGRKPLKSEHSRSG